MSDNSSLQKIDNVYKTEMEDSKPSHNTKAERHKRKKDNAKKAKAEARLKAEEESRLLDDLATLTVKAKQKEQAQKLVDKSRDGAGLTGPENVYAADKSLPFAPPGLFFKFDHSTDRGGIGAYALQDIKAGTEILVEEAILKGTNGHICKEALFKVLSDDKKKRVMSLYHHCNCKVPPCTETRLAHIHEINSYGAPSGPALYELAARFNHDCLPNIARGFSKEEFMIFRAARDIKKGEELTVNYTMISGPTKARRGYLLEKFDFLCKCNGCKNNMVCTESDVAKARLPKCVEPTALVIGRFTKEEAAAFADVEAWFDGVQKGMMTIQRAQYDYMAKHVVAQDPRVLDRKGRSFFAKRTLASIVQYLKLNNKFGLDDAVFDSFQARNAEQLAEATETNFGVMMEELVGVER